MRWRKVTIELHQQVKDQAAKRKGTSPANDKGAPLANRLQRHASKPTLCTIEKWLATR